MIEQKLSVFEKSTRGGGGGLLAYVVIRGCAIILGIFWGLLPDFWVSFFGYSRIFGYHFLVKFDFFKSNPDLVVLILIFPSMTLWNIAGRALVSYYLCRNVK